MRAARERTSARTFQMTSAPRISAPATIPTARIPAAIDPPESQTTGTTTAAAPNTIT